MNKKEVAVILKTISEIYGSKFKTDDPKGMLQSWSVILENDEFNIIHDNLMQYARHNKFPPSVNDLLEPAIEERDRAVLNTKETKKMIDSWDKNREPDKEQADEALKQMRDILGIKRG